MALRIAGRITAALIAALFTVGMGYGPGRAYAVDVTIKIGHVAPPSTAFQINSVEFGNQLKALSKGTMEVEIVPGGALGNIIEHWAQLRAGSLDAHVIDVGAILPMKEARAFFVLLMPYLFRDHDHWHAYLKSDIFKEMMGKVEQDTGIKFIGPLGDRPPRALTTRAKAVKTPADLVGLKIRTPENPAMTEVFARWGATPTQVKGAELYSALQSGLVDGQENGIDAVVQAGLTEVQKYFMPINYAYSGVGLWLSGRKWASLTPQQQEWVIAAAAATDAKANAAYKAEVAELFDQAAKKGMIVVEPDIEAFRKLARPMIDEKDGKAWPAGLYDKIRALR
jgi:TRAP-type transport system periplasmic protein